MAQNISALNNNPNPRWIETAVFNGNLGNPRYLLAGAGAVEGCVAAFSAGAALLAGSVLLAGAVLSDAGFAAAFSVVFCAAAALSNTMEAGL